MAAETNPVSALEMQRHHRRPPPSRIKVRVLFGQLATRPELKLDLVQKEHVRAAFG